MSSTSSSWRTKWIDYYEILGLDRNADAKTIKKKYRKLATKYHPDAYKGEDGKDKVSLILEAYRVLHDEEEKKAYDSMWDSRHKEDYRAANDSASNATEANYEDMQKNYTDEEKKYAKRLALKKIIEEELQKIELIINSKSEVIFSVYSGNIDKREYYATVKELVSIGFSFINDLKALANEAYKYDLLEEEELINQAILFLEDELKSIPLTPKDAKVYAEKEICQEQVKIKIADELAVNAEIISKLRKILISAYYKEITHLNYRNILVPVLWEAKHNMSNLKELGKMARTFSLEEESKLIIDAISCLDSMFIMTPRNYEEAGIAGQKEIVKEKIRDSLRKWDEYQKKIDKINNILLKYPNSWRYEQLYDYAISIFEEEIIRLNGVKKEIEPISQGTTLNNKAQDLSKKALDIYKEAEKIHKKANVIYEKRERKTFLVGEKNAEIITLIQDAYASWDKGEALELLTKAQVLVATITLINDHDEELKKLTQQLSDKISQIAFIKQEFISKYYLDKNNPYANFTDIDFQYLIDKLDIDIVVNIVKALITSLICSGSIIFLFEQKNANILLSMFLGLTSLTTASVCYNAVERIERIKNHQEYLMQLLDIYQNKTTAKTK